MSPFILQKVSVGREERRIYHISQACKIGSRDIKSNVLSISCLFFSYYRAKHKQCPECNINIGNDPARSAGEQALSYSYCCGDTLANTMIYLLMLVAVFRSDGSLRELAKVLFPAVYKEDEEREREFYAKKGIPPKPTNASEDLEGLERKPPAVNLKTQASNTLLGPLFLCQLFSPLLSPLNVL